VGGLLWLSLLSAARLNPRLTHNEIGPGLSMNQIEIAGGADGEDQEM
jgi:hypothetical protein